MGPNPPEALSPSDGVRARVWPRRNAGSRRPLRGGEVLPLLSPAESEVALGVISPPVTGEVGDVGFVEAPEADARRERALRGGGVSERSCVRGGEAPTCAGGARSASLATLGCDAEWNMRFVSGALETRRTQCINVGRPGVPGDTGEEPVEGGAGVLVSGGTAGASAMERSELELRLGSTPCAYWRGMAVIRIVSAYTMEEGDCGDVRPASGLPDVSKVNSRIGASGACCRLAEDFLVSGATRSLLNQPEPCCPDWPGDEGLREPAVAAMLVGDTAAVQSSRCFTSLGSPARRCPAARYAGGAHPMHVMPRDSASGRLIRDSCAWASPPTIREA